MKENTLKLAVGTNVKIIGGEFDGVKGVIQAHDEGRDRFFYCIESEELKAIGCEYVIGVTDEDLEVIDAE